MEIIKEHGMIIIGMAIFFGLWLTVFRKLDPDDFEQACHRNSRWENSANLQTAGADEPLNFRRKNDDQWRFNQVRARPRGSVVQKAVDTLRRRGNRYREI
jgi:hypothetical protein